MAAAVYAAGYSPDDIIKIVKDNQFDRLYGFRRGPAMLRIKSIYQALSYFLSDETFSDLNIPIALTAVDLKTMTEVILKDGIVFDAVMATVAIPGIFPPKEWDDYLLIDGAVLDPVPVRVSRSLVPGLPVIAVPLIPVPDRWKEVSPWGKPSDNPLLRPISRLRVAKAFEIYLRSTDMTGHMLSELRLQADSPEVVIRPEVGHIGRLDNVDIERIADLGEVAVEESLEELQQLMGGKNRRKWFKRDQE
jgi:NTE family protein